MGLLRDIGDKLAFWRDDSPKVDEKFRDMTDEELKGYLDTQRETERINKNQQLQAAKAQKGTDEAYKQAHNERSFADRTTTRMVRKVTKGGEIYDEYPSSDVTEEVRAKYSDSTPKTSKAKTKEAKTKEVETEEATINGKQVRIPKATKRQKQMFISNRGNAYYAWKAQQQAAYAKARAHAK